MKKYSGFIALALIAAIICTFALTFAGPSTTDAKTDFPDRVTDVGSGMTLTRSKPTMDPIRIVTANGIQMVDKDAQVLIEGVRFTVKKGTNGMGEIGLTNSSGFVEPFPGTASGTRDGIVPNVFYLVHEGEYVLTVPSKWRDEPVVMFGAINEDGIVTIKSYTLSKWNATFPDKAISESYLKDWNEANDWTMVLGTWPDCRLGTLNNEDVSQVFAARQAKIDAWNAKYPNQAFTGNCYPEVYALYGANGTEGGTTPTPSIPATGTAYPQKLAVIVDGTRVEFDAYYLLDEKGYPTNYVKVRDLAYVINGTKAQFAVEWNAAAGKADLVAGKAYTANGSENNTPFNDPRPYSLPQNATYVNGVPSDLAAFMLFDDRGGGYTYFQLRDLGRKLGFNVGWYTDRGIAHIETFLPYVG